MQTVFRTTFSCVSDVISSAFHWEAIEEKWPSTRPKYNLKKPCVDGSFCIIERNAKNSFHTSLHYIDPHNSFTIDQQIPFLDTLVSPKDNIITIGVYRKATHSDR